MQIVDKKIVGERLKQLRDDKKETLEQTAKAVGASISAISMYESGERTPRDEMKVALANHFGVPLSIFFEE